MGKRDKKKFNEIRQTTDENSKLFTWVDNRKNKVTGKETKELIDHIINQADKEDIDDKTIEMYNGLQKLGNKMIKANEVNFTEGRERLIKIYQMVEEII